MNQSPAPHLRIPCATLIVLLSAAGCGGSNNRTTAPPATLQSVTVTAASSSIKAGATTQLVATGLYTDSSRVDVTTKSTWSSSDPVVASIGSTTGLVVGAAPGSAVMTATFSGMSGSVTEVVTNAVIETVLHAFSGRPDGYSPVDLIQASDGSLYGTTFYGGAYPDVMPQPGQPGSGTVFKLTPPNQEEVFYSFGALTGAADGEAPRALIQGAAGDFYGTTAGGGAAGHGTVFKLTSTGVQTVLHAFQASSSGAVDGIEPNGLVQGRDGNLYGTTLFGGTDDQGTVFRVTLGGAETLLHAFSASGDGRLPGSLIQADDGNLYGVTGIGGAFDNGTVFKITPAGDESVLYSFGGGSNQSDGYRPSGGFIQARDGNFYGTTADGGTNDCGVIFKLTPAGEQSVVYSFTGTADGCDPGSLIQGSDGNLYGTDAYGQRTAGAVFRLTPAGVFTVLYSFAGESDGSTPAVVVQSSDGTLYGLTSYGGLGNNGVVFRLD